MGKNRKPSGFSDVIRIFRMVKGFSKMLVLSSAIRTICKMSSIVLAVTLALMVSFFMGGKSISVGGWLTALGIMLVMVVVVSYLDTYISHDVSFKIVKQLQNKMYDHMDKISPGGLENINSADSATIILSDINVFEWFVAHCLVEWIGTFSVLLICLILLSSISFFAAIVVFVFLTVMFIIPFLSTKQARQKGFLMKRLFGELNGIVADGVSGHKDIMGFHWTRAFYNKLSDVSSTYSRAQGQFALRNENERTLEAVVSCLAIVFGLMPLSVFQTPYVSDYLNMGAGVLSYIKVLMIVGMMLGAFCAPKLLKIPKGTLCVIAGIVMGISLICMHTTTLIVPPVFKLALLTFCMISVGIGGAYARVSSDSEDQLNSFAAQIRYYTELLSGSTDMVFVDMYADEGITGTSATKRADFQRLMSDCRKGKIDRILTKSVSRFARNTKDCLEAVRELKTLDLIGKIGFTERIER